MASNLVLASAVLLCPGEHRQVTAGTAINQRVGTAIEPGIDRLALVPPHAISAADMAARAHQPIPGMAKCADQSIHSQTAVYLVDDAHHLLDRGEFSHAARCSASSKVDCFPSIPPSPNQMD
eukprot:2622371-Rhodomonas_salina.1